MKYSLAPPPPRPPRLLSLLMHPPIVKKCRATAQFASPNLSRKQRTLSGAVLLVETTSTINVSNSGQRARPGKRFDVYIGKRVLDAA